MALMLVGLAVPSVAQKNNTPSKEEKKVFVGVINYETKSGRPAKQDEPAAAPQKASRPDLRMAPAVAAVSKEAPAPKYPLSLYADQKMVTVDQGPARASMWGDDALLRLDVVEKGHVLSGEMPVDIHYRDLNPLLKEVTSFVACGKYDSAHQSMLKLYNRTGETKKICNHTCVKYFATKGQIAGKEIWVCEDYVLAHYMTPFWGMIYPVFEADFNLPFEGLRPFHIKAVNITTGADAVMKASAYSLPIQSVGFHEILDRLIQDPERFNRHE